jgi:hypothetical protein
MTQGSDPNVSIRSISLVDFDDSTVDVDVRTNIENLAKTCGMYGLFVCSSSPPNTSFGSIAEDLVTSASAERGCCKLFVIRKITQDVIAADQAKESADNASLSLDANQVALDNEKGPAGTLSPSDQDKALADQEQLTVEQNQIPADQYLVSQDKRQAAKEQAQMEDQALKMVKTLVDMAARA